MLLKNGHLVDPTQAIDGETDIRIENGVLVEVGPDLVALKDEEVFDLTGLYVVPGLIDTHVHLRDPGYEDSEDLESGTKAAIAGGFTTVISMPNTNPVIDNVPMVTYLIEKSKRLGYADVLPTAAITKGELGQELTEFGLLLQAGAIAFSEDGKSVADSAMMRKAMDYGKGFKALFMNHCEDLSLRGAGVMNESSLSTAMGLAGSPKEAEEIIIMRDIMLAKLTGARLHIQHISTAGGVEMVRKAQAENLPVTCEVTPHHLFLTQEKVVGYNTHAKVAPPLRTQEDNQALLKALKDGVIACIGTDHAPHAQELKECEFDRAAYGISSIEIAFPLMWTHLVETGLFTLSEIIQLMSVNAAKLLNLEKGSLKPGAVADVLVIDPKIEKKVNPRDFYSKGKNCPYAGEVLSGWPKYVFRAGRLVLKNGEILG